MAQLDSAAAGAAVAASPLLPRYGEEIDRESAYERLLAKVTAAPPPAQAAEPAPPARPAPRPGPGRAPEKGVVSEVLGSPAVKSFLRSAASAAGREIMRSLFGTARRRR
jgi:hypothetical protein